MRPLWIIVVIVLVDLLGFSLVVPLLPLYAKQSGFNGTQIGLLLAMFPLCQLVAGPILGRLSDRFGRRPVLIYSQLGALVSFLILAFTHNYWLMLAARAIDGASGGNILVAQAYIADVTRPEQRSKGLGLIGAAFGVGFTLGPLIAGLLASLPVNADWQLRLPFLAAACCAAVASVLTLLWLPESRERGTVASLRRGLSDVLGNRRLALLIVIGSLTTLAFASMEGTFSLFLEARLGWKANQALFAFAAIGIAAAIVQGGLLRPLVTRLGEARLVLGGLLVLALGFVVLTQANGLGMLGLAIVLICLGYGLGGPSVTGLLSRLSPASEQGAVFGVLSSAQTCARMLNYPIANLLLERRGESAPYWEAVAITLAAWLVAVYAFLRVIGMKPTTRTASVAPLEPEVESVAPGA